MQEDLHTNNSSEQRQDRPKQHHHQFTDVTFRTIRPPPELQWMTQQEVVQALASELPSTRSAPGGGRLPPTAADPAQQQQQHHRHQQSQHQQQQQPVQHNNITNNGFQDNSNNNKDLAYPSQATMKRGEIQRKTGAEA